MNIVNGGKAYVSTVCLDEYPWVRDEMPQLNNGGWVHHICRGVDEQVIGKIVLQTFISTENERVVSVLPRGEVNVDLLRRIINDVDNYVKGLDESKSCEIDPKTGRSPVPHSDFDDPDSW